MKNEIISAQDGYKIKALVLTPITPNPKAVIQFHSGTVTKKEFYLKLANYLVDQKYIVVLFDYRGVGESKPKNLRGFEMSISDWGRDDANSVTEWIKNEYPNQAVHLLAHSMGGQIYGLMQNWKIFEKVILLTTSSGNFNKFSPISYKLKVKWPALLLFPLLIKIYGYIPKRYGVGEDWPKGVAQDWIKNSKINGLMPVYLNAKVSQSYYQQIDKEITAWYFPDDSMSTPETIKELALSYPNARLKIQIIQPVEVGLEKVGHFGLFKSKAKDRLWPMLVEEIER